MTTTGRSKPPKLPPEVETAIAERAVAEVFERIAADDGPIVVGPWLAEVGFEVLYWIPFLRFLVARGNLDPARVVVVSRGGVQDWYEGIGTRYVELFDAVGADSFRLHTDAIWDALGGRKQTELTERDEYLLDASLGDEWHGRPILHPSHMYGVFRLWWRSAVPIRYALDRLRFERWSAPFDPATEAKLPDDFVAVRFYFRPSFPDTTENRRLARRIIDRLCEVTNVVSLNANLDIDDHLDFDVADGRMIRLFAGDNERDNLRIQSAAIARARLFIGTYGGLAYLAPLYGGRSIAFATTHGLYNPTHLEVALHAAAQLGGSLTILDNASEGLLECAAST